MGSLRNPLCGIENGDNPKTEALKICTVEEGGVEMGDKKVIEAWMVRLRDDKPTSKGEIS